MEYGFTEERTRSLLGGMLFHGDDVFKEIGTLSGGQKARLVLLKLVLDGANCLVLDEPTNHLDIMARETVEAALTAFDGTVLVVSHAVILSTRSLTGSGNWKITGSVIIKAIMIFI